MSATTASCAAWSKVYRDPARFWELYELAEKLVDLEDYFRRWRFNHVTTVERVIGFKRGTGGTSGVSYLRKMLEVVLFPELWQVRTVSCNEPDRHLAGAPCRHGLCFPGDADYRVAQTFTIGPGCPVNVGSFAMSTHCGAHVDAPLHYDAEGASIDQSGSWRLHRPGPGDRCPRQGPALPF